MRYLPRLPNVLVLLSAVAACVASAAFDARGRIVDTDVNLFASGGSWMLSGDWAHTYHDPSVQAGPLELALTALMRRAGEGTFGFALLLDLVCIIAVFCLAMWLLRGRTAGVAAFAAGAVALQLPREGFRGHPAELLIPVLWILAAHQARRGRSTLAGALIGASGCLELWGVLGVAVLALAPIKRRTAAGALAAVAIPASSLLPFAVGGDFHMFEYRWPILTGLGGLVLPGTTFTWYDRVVEGALVVAVGAFVARGTRSLPESVWIAPAVVAFAKIALDPVNYFYYWDTPIVIVLIGASSLIVRRRELELRLASRLTSPSPSAIKFEGVPADRPFDVD